MKLSIVAALALFCICQDALAGPVDHVSPSEKVRNLRAAVKSAISDLAIAKNSLTTRIVKDALERQTAANREVGTVSASALKEIEKAVKEATKVYKDIAGCNAEARYNVVGTAQTTVANIDACTQAARNNRAVERFKTELERIQWFLNSLEINAGNVISNCDHDESDRFDHCIVARAGTLMKELAQWENAITKANASEDNIFMETEKLQADCNSNALDYFKRTAQDVVKKNQRCLQRLS